jgi:hypothetical protein
MRNLPSPAKMAEPQAAALVVRVKANDPALRSKAHEIDARLDIMLKGGVYLW